MSNTVQNAVRTINRLRKEALQQASSNPARARILLERACALANDPWFPTRALLVAKARTLHVLAYSYYKENNLDAALHHMSNAAALFQETAEINEYMKAVNMMQVIHHHKGEYAVALELLQSCLQLEHKATNRRLMGQIHCNTGILFSTLSDFPQAMKHFQQALLIAEECKNYVGICLALTNIAMSHRSSGKLLLALECLLKALLVAENIDSNREQTTGKLFMKIGDILRLLGSYDQALAYQLRSLALLEKHGSRIDVGSVFKYLGLIYLNKKEYSSARAYLLRALDIHDGKNGAQQVRITSMVILARIELALGNTNEAQRCALDALHMSEATNDIQKKGDALALAAEIYHAEREYTTARAYYQQSLAICDSENNAYGKISILIGIGYTFACQEHYAEALEYFHKAQVFAERTDAKPLLHSAYEALANTYERADNTKRALEYFKLFHTTNEEIFNEKAEQHMQVLTILHNVEQAERESVLQKQRNEQLQHSVEQSQQTLTVHALHLAQQTDLLQKVKGEISVLLTQQMSALQQEVRKSIEMLVDITPRPRKRGVSAKEKTLHRVTGTLVVVEQEMLPAVHRRLQSIGDRFDSTLLDQGMWSAFEQQFQQLHSGFMETVAQRYPQLSTTEVKVCALLKMNMSSKEIGHILNVSLRSVETYRYNIRKKLKLAAKDSLAQYIAELS